MILSPELFNAALLVAAPLVLAAVGGAISNQAGIFNFTLEGLMLFAAFFAVFFTIETQNASAGVLAAVVLTTVVSLVYGFVVLQLGADPIIAAFGVNLLSLGATSFLLRAWLGQIGGVFAPTGLGNATPSFVEALPLLGPVLARQNILVYAALVSGPLAYLFLTRTPLGLAIRAAGEAPEAAEAAGLKVKRVRYAALAITGVMCALAGAELSLGFLSQFTDNMTAGRGIIAFAAVIFGRNLPIPVWLTALFFGFASAFTDRLQGLGLPAELVVLVPYLAAVVALAIASRRAMILEQRTTI